MLLWPTMNAIVSVSVVGAAAAAGGLVCMIMAPLGQQHGMHNNNNNWDKG